MKKTLISSVLLSAGLAFAGGASALTINAGAVTVGDVDTLVATASDAVNSGYANELAWLQDHIGGVISYTKWDVDAADWIAVDGSTTIRASNLGLNAGDYFFIKTGNVDGTSFDHFLFLNNDELQWAVLDLASIFSGDKSFITDFGKVSHIGNVNAVPLPGAAWLFASALLGFMAVANRRKV